MDWKEALQNLNLPSDADAPESTTPAPTEPFSADKLLIELDRKGRKGKEATIISGFSADDGAVARIASQLKSKLGTGGSARGGEILVQGDRRDAVARILTSMGYKVKIQK